MTRTPSQSSAESAGSWMFASTTVVSARTVRLLDALPVGEADQDAMDGLQGLGADALDVVLERLEARPLVEAETDEAAEGGGVLQVELELAVTQSVDLLEHGDPEHLVPAQSASPGAGT